MLKNQKDELKKKMPGKQAQGFQDEANPKAPEVPIESKEKQNLRQKDDEELARQAADRYAEAKRFVDRYQTLIEQPVPSTKNPIYEPGEIGINVFPSSPEQLNDLHGLSFWTTSSPTEDLVKMLQSNHTLAQQIHPLERFAASVEGTETFEKFRSFARLYAKLWTALEKAKPNIAAPDSFLRTHLFYLFPRILIDALRGISSSLYPEKARRLTQIEQQFAVYVKSVFDRIYNFDVKFVDEEYFVNELQDEIRSCWREFRELRCLFEFHAVDLSEPGKIHVDGREVTSEGIKQSLAAIACKAADVHQPRIERDDFIRWCHGDVVNANKLFSNDFGKLKQEYPKIWTSSAEGLKTIEGLVFHLPVPEAAQLERFQFRNKTQPTAS